MIAYSLGATQAQRFLIDFWRQVGQAIFINGPSLERTAAQRFADEMNRQELVFEGDPLQIEIYRNEDDAVSCGGAVHLGHGIRLESPVRLNLVEFQNAPSLSWLLGSHSFRSGERAHLSAMQSQEAIGAPRQSSTRRAR